MFTITVTFPPQHQLPLQLPAADIYTRSDNLGIYPGRIRLFFYLHLGNTSLGTDLAILGFYRSVSASRLVRSGRETSIGYKHCQPGQRFFAVPNRTVHFLSSICSDCIQCWSSCRGSIVRSLKKATKPPLKLINPWGYPTFVSLYMWKIA